MTVRLTALAVVLASGLLVAPPAADAQQAGRVWRVGLLSAVSPGVGSKGRTAFSQRLYELGYVEGQNIAIERRWAEGRYELLPELAAGLVRVNVDVIVAVSTPAARAAKQATSSIPIVFVAVSDPVGTGLVTNLARPGGNLTGTTDIGVDLARKRLDLLKQLIPRLRRVAVLGNRSSTLWEPIWQETQAAARRLRIDVVPVLVATPNELESAFADLPRRVEGIIVAPEVMFFFEQRRIVELASRSRLPAIYEWREFVDAGGLMSYGATIASQYERAAVYVGKILKGAKPADLPIEQPTRFELVVNLQTAKALGLKIPQPILVRADEVIR